VVANGGKPVYEDARQALAELGVGDVLPAAVLSDNFQSVVDRVVEERFSGRFVVAHGVEPGVEGRRRRKPDTGKLRAALDAVGVPRDRTLVVGDGTRDVAVADRAGVDSAFVHRDAAQVDDYDPTYRLDDLEALVGIVDG
jgi:hypothetical protein